MQARLRRFLAEYNQRSGVTVILTSHYMADVVALCPRVILIHHGQLLYDGELSGLAEQLAPFKLIRVTLRKRARPATVERPGTACRRGHRRAAEWAPDAARGALGSAGGHGAPAERAACGRPVGRGPADRSRDRPDLSGGRWEA